VSGTGKILSYVYFITRKLISASPYEVLTVYGLTINLYVAVEGIFDIVITLSPTTTPVPLASI
jgi:hypothetical protein